MLTSRITPQVHLTSHNMETSFQRALLGKAVTTLILTRLVEIKVAQLRIVSEAETAILSHNHQQQPL